MHTIASHSRQRLTQFARRVQDEIAVSEDSDAESVLETRLEELEYLVERETATISSCLGLVNRQEANIQANLSGRRDSLVERLQRAAKYEADSLREFVETL